MHLIELARRLAAVAPPTDLSCWLLLIAVGATALSGWLRARDALRRNVFALAYLAVGSTVLLVVPRGKPSPLVIAVAVTITLIPLTIHVVRRADSTELDDDGATSALWVDLVWIAAAAATAALFLFVDLAGYAGTLMVWEEPVIRGFAEFLDADVGVLAHFGRNLLWGEGVVSSSQDSLLYGGPTYLLWRLVGVNVFTLRVAAAVAALFALAAAWLAGRMVGSRFVATAATAALAVSPVLVFYGRYGTSLAVTLFTLLLALAAACLMMDDARDRWYAGLVLAAALYLGTLGYTVGRLLVVTMLAAVLLLHLLRWRRLTWRRWIALGLLISGVAGVFLVQRHFDRTRLFTNARGEHLGKFMQSREAIRSYLGRDLDPQQMTTFDRLELTARVVERTLPEMAAVAAQPFQRSQSVHAVLWGDPPRLPLAHGPLLLFALWGTAMALRRPLQPAHLLLLAMVAAATVPVLLTNRVDVHRLMPITVPLIVLTALGIRDAARIATACRVPPAVLHAAAAGLFLSAIAFGSALLYDDNPPSRDRAVPMVHAVRHLDSPLTVTAFVDDREVGLMRLDLLDRQRRDPSERWAISSKRTVAELRDKVGPAERTIDEIEVAGGSGTVVMGPAGEYNSAAAILQERGLWVQLQGTKDIGYWLVAPPGSSIAEDGGLTVPLPTPTPRPPPALFTAVEGRVEPLDASSRSGLDFGFEPPRVDEAWGGGPIRIGGAEYRRGLGMHAWTRTRFPVPRDAAAFRAIIGLSDRVVDCPRALVTFEVRGDSDELLFDSGPTAPGDGGRAITVPVAGQREITLVVTEAGNGRDCDHGCWAEPGFVFE